jgi:hypothetical protein
MASFIYESAPLDEDRTSDLERTSFGIWPYPDAAPVNECGNTDITVGDEFSTHIYLTRSLKKLAIMNQKRSCPDFR